MRKFCPSFLVAAIAFAAVSATAGVPQLVNYQGVLTDLAGVPVADGMHSVTFAIYDQESGANPALWTEAQNVSTEDGLFNVLLGTVTSLDESVFSGPDRWLGITVGADPELSPRTRLTTAPFAYRVATVDGATGGTIAGNTSIQSDLAVNGQIEASGPESKIRFHYDDLVDLPDPSAYHGMFAHVHNEGKAYYAHAGQWVPLADEAHTHDASALADEPGIVSAHSASTTVLTQGITTMVDVITCTITTPTAGYIKVQGRGNCGHLGPNITGNWAFFQIDEASGGDKVAPYFSESGAGNAFGLATSFYCERIYSKPAGTYTFRLEGRAHESNGPDAVTQVVNPSISAVFIPTAYGAVAP